MPQSTGADLLVSALRSESVSTVFGLPGIQLDPVMEAMYQQRAEIDFLAVRHEQSATYMADGYARVSGQPGVAMVVPGPGVLNAGAGLATAYACSSPVMLIAGSIESSMRGRGLGALHEISGQTELLSSLTKWSAVARYPEEVPELVHEAFFQMRSGHPRPVALEVPPDVMRATTSAEVGSPRPPQRVLPDAATVARIAELIVGARKPFLYVGGGALAADSGEDILAIAEILGLPVVTTRNGRGVLDSRHPLVFDPIALRRFSAEADLMVAFGTRLGSGDGGSSDIGDAKVVMVNVDEGAFRFPRPVAVGLRADAALGARAIADALRSRGEVPDFDWGATPAEVHAWTAEQFRDISPQMEYLQAIRTALPDDGVLVSEYTQVGYVSSIAFPNHRVRGFVSPGYQGTLGYGFATALGAQVAAGSSPVVSINGDGGFSWTLSELSTVKKYGLPVTIVVFNDGYYYNVHRMQRENFDAHHIGTDLTNPDYVALAHSFGIDATRVEGPSALGDAIAASVRSGRPNLIEVPVGEFPSPWHLIDV